MPSYTISPDEVVKQARVVAVVGASKNPEKEAYTVPLYLMENGFVVIPINPSANSIFGVRTFPTLADLPDEVAKRVEVVDVFRPSDDLADVSRQVVFMKGRTGKVAVFWAQLGLQSAAAEKILKENSVPYVMDVCIRTQHMDYSRRNPKSGPRTNAEWHQKNPMPKNPTNRERVEWHLEHAKNCGCRPIPASVSADLASL